MFLATRKTGPLQTLDKEFHSLLEMLWQGNTHLCVLYLALPRCKMILSFWIGNTEHLTQMNLGGEWR